MPGGEGGGGRLSEAVSAPSRGSQIPRDPSPRATPSGPHALTPPLLRGTGPQLHSADAARKPGPSNCAGASRSRPRPRRPAVRSMRAGLGPGWEAQHRLRRGGACPRCAPLRESGAVSGGGPGYMAVVESEVSSAWLGLCAQRASCV